MMAALEWIARSVDAHPFVATLMCAFLCFFAYSESRKVNQAFAPCEADSWRCQFLSLICDIFRQLDIQIQFYHISTYTDIVRTHLLMFRLAMNGWEYPDLGPTFGLGLTEFPSSKTVHLGLPILGDGLFFWMVLDTSKSSEKYLRMSCLQGLSWLRRAIQDLLIFRKPDQIWFSLFKLVSF